MMLNLGLVCHSRDEPKHIFAHFKGLRFHFFITSGFNRLTANPNLPDNQLAQEAVNLTLFHWLVNERYFHMIVCQQKHLSCQGSTRMGGLFPCWSAPGPDDPQEGLAPYHEVLFLSIDW